MSTQSFQPYRDFRIRATTQLFGISQKMDIETFSGWMDEIGVENNIEHFFLYLERGVASKPYCDLLEERYPTREIHILPNVPSDEILKIIEFVDSVDWEKSHTIQCTHSTA